MHKPSIAATGVARLRAANVSAVTRIAKKRKKAPVPLSAVTTPLQRIESSREIMTKKPVEGRPKAGSLDPRIVPDAKWPGIYRIRLPDGSLSDMANLKAPARSGLSFVTAPGSLSRVPAGAPASQENGPISARDERIMEPIPPTRIEQSGHHSREDRSCLALVGESCCNSRAPGRLRQKPVA